MSLSASEYYEVGLSLPPSVRKDVALQLLESVEVMDQDSVDGAWKEEISSRLDDLLGDRVQTVPGEQVFAELTGRRASRRTATDA